jgi:hypothetical protein
MSICRCDMHSFVPHDGAVGLWVERSIDYPFVVQR